MLLSQISLWELQNLAAETRAAATEILAQGQVLHANAAVNQRNPLLEQFIVVTPAETMITYS